MTNMTPAFALKLNNWSLPGAQRFLDVIQSVEPLQEAANFILSTLFTSENNPPEVRSITIIITSHTALKTMGALAFQSPSDLDPTHRRIEISESWLAQIAPERLTPELLGVLRHELVHCFQTPAPEHTPGGLIEGIADWIRLRSGLGPPHWTPQTTGTARWDAGYETTAYFLDYLEREYGEGSVAVVNQKACCDSYSEAMWEEVFGKSVHVLWKEYCKQQTC